MRNKLGEQVLAAGEAFDDRADACIDRAFWLAGPVLVVVGFFLSLFLYTVGTQFILPAKRYSWEVERACGLLAGVGLGNILFRYLFAVFTNPGTVSSRAYARLLGKRSNHAVAEDGECKHPLLKWRVCKITGEVKPPRCHFDSVNRKLVLGFDHWCPWVFNSVGYGNYRHFVWLLVWVWALTLLGVVVTADLVAERIKFGHSAGEWELQILVLIEFACCLGLNLATGLLLSWHLYLVTSGQTSIDHLVLEGRRTKELTEFWNPFDLGSVYANLQGALLSEGGGWWEAIIPPSPQTFPFGKPFPTAEW